MAKIIYALTPSPNLPNVGDHVQALAITQWLEDNFTGYVLLEFNKDEVYRYIDPLKRIVNDKDLVFLHSGGNLGDRGIWSENARRLLIQNFPHNRIISLPQTIFFSPTPTGQKELGITKDIYNRHAQLTIMARDEFSFALAQKYFPRCKVMLFPDFVLYVAKASPTKSERRGALLCLRRDNESSVDAFSRRHILKALAECRLEYAEFDTTFRKNIQKNDREQRLEETLCLFRTVQLVITDRFHGVIFAVMTNTPCVALKTVDHKLTESVKWFKEYPSVAYLEDVAKLPDAINAVLTAHTVPFIDWRAKYFAGLKKVLVEEA